MNSDEGAHFIWNNVHYLFGFTDSEEMEETMDISSQSEIESEGDSIQDSEEDDFILPSDLRQISKQEKRELLRFRKSHTEVRLLSDCNTSFNILML